MRFTVKKFDRHLENIGQNYLWRRAYTCSCINPESGAPDHKCGVCFGKGHYWLPGQQCVAATASQKTQATWEKMGAHEDGDIAITIPQSSPMWECGQFDRVVMLNGSDRFSIPLKRGAVSERILFTVETVERVFWKAQGTQNLVDGGIPVVSNSGQITWPSGGEPPPGVTYSITGRKRSEYFVFKDMPNNRNMHSGYRLPRTTVLRRFDLLGR